MKIEKDVLHQVLFLVLLIIGSIAVWEMLKNGMWSEVVTAILGVVGTILTLDVTKRDEHE